MCSSSLAYLVRHNSAVAVIHPEARRLVRNAIRDGAAETAAAEAALPPPRALLYSVGTPRSAGTDFSRDCKGVKKCALQKCEALVSVVAMRTFILRVSNQELEHQVPSQPCSLESYGPGGTLQCEIPRPPIMGSASIIVGSVCTPNRSRQESPGLGTPRKLSLHDAWPGGKPLRCRDFFSWLLV